MDRLTYRDKDGMAMMKERGGWKSGGIDRLAAYEDSGLEPEEIIGLKNTCEQLIGINDSLFKANQEMGKDLAEWKKALMISRAPQSWCYVEELKGGEG